MIFYFSATGNSKYIAERISKELNEKIVSISDCIKAENFSFTIENNEQIGFITPTYFWGLPSIVCEFLNKINLNIKGNNYIYHVATFGTTTGQVARMTNNLLIKKGLSLDGRFSVKMVDTWTPTFNLTNKNKINRINEKVEKQIEDVYKLIKNNTPGDFSHNKLPMFAVKIEYSNYKKKRKTKNFYVEDTCINCGFCAKKCPTNAIKMQNNKPIWVEDECTLCLGCLHRCPKFAIQYGKNTKKHGQFINPNVKI